MSLTQIVEDYRAELGAKHSANERTIRSIDEVLASIQDQITQLNQQKESVVAENAQLLALDGQLDKIVEILQKSGN